MSPLLPALPVAAVLAFDAAGAVAQLADLVSAGAAIADQLKAQEGLKYNPYVFAQSLSTQSAAGVSKSASTPKPPGQTAKTAGLAAKSKGPIGLVEIAPSSGLLLVSSKNAAAAFHLYRYRARDEAIVYVVHLKMVRGFNTQILDQMEVHFAGAEVPGGHLLTASGFVNKARVGFFHFYCDYFVRGGAERDFIVPLSGESAGTEPKKPEAVKDYFHISF